MDTFDWPRIRRLIWTELEPRRLVERIASDRERRANYPWTSLPFVLWRSDAMSEMRFDELVKETIARIRSDTETRAVLEQLDCLGFRYLLGTYDDPGMRLFHINVQHNIDAEQRALGTSRSQENGETPRLL